MKNSLIKFAKIFAVVLVLIWKLINVIYSIDYEGAVAFTERALGIPETVYYVDDTSFYVVDSFTEFFNNYFFPIFLTTTFVLSIIGTLILTRRRSAFSAAGLLMAFIIPRENIFYGSVKDGSTGAPVPFAVIRAFRQNSKGEKEYIGQTVADLDARYSLHVTDISPDCMLEVEAEGYEPVHENINGVTSKTPSFNITQDIYLSGAKSSHSKGISIFNRPEMYRIVIWTVYAASVLYFLTFVFYFIAWTAETYGWIMLAIFTFSVFVNTKTIKQRFFSPKGRVLDIFTKEPIKAVNVSVFKDGRKLETYSSDENGIVKINLTGGEHNVSVEKQGYVLKKPVPWRVIGSSYFAKVNIDKEGYLIKDLLMESKEGESLSNSTPFS